MSRHHRANDIWPADDDAVQVWHLVACLEDLVDLFEASQRAATEGSRVALMKKALVELKSFDDLVGVLQSAIRTSSRVSAHHRELVIAALSEYQRAVEPSREVLADIRNTIAAHRHSLPDARQRKRFGEDFQVWGTWEQTLVNLEAKCTPETWLPPINAAVALRNVVLDAGVGTWFSVNAGGLRLYLPIKIEGNDNAV